MLFCLWVVNSNLRVISSHYIVIHLITQTAIFFFLIQLYSGSYSYIYHPSTSKTRPPSHPLQRRPSYTQQYVSPAFRFLTEHMLNFSIPQEYRHREQTKCSQDILPVGGPIQPSILLPLSPHRQHVQPCTLRSFRKQSRSGQGSGSATRSVVLCLLQTVFRPVALFKGASMQCLMGYRLSWPQLYTLTYL